jgi:segregation and condensation protein B
MAFDLKRVLKVMLFASNGTLSVKDIQTAISRFHEQTDNLPFTEESEAPAGEDAEAAPAPAPAEVAANEADAEEISIEGAAPAPVDAEVTEAIAGPAEDDEMYRDVPSLITTTQIREAMDAIAAELQTANSEILLVEGNSGWRLVSHPRFARWVRLLRNEPPPVRLTASALETLAVIAYRQPVTRSEIEQIRGVSAEAGIAKLLERDLIYVVGRAELPGRPTQFGTTDAFLEFVGIKSLDELPASDVLSPRQIDAWLQSANEPRPAGDSDMGLDENETTQLSLDQAPVATATAEGEASAEESGEARPAE